MKKHSALFFFILVFGVLSSFAEMSDAKLKERLTDGLLKYMVKKQFSSESTEDVGDPFSYEFREVTDEQFHRVLMEIYNETEEKWLALTPNTPEWGRNKENLVGVIVCLPMCADSSTKEFLLDYAANNENDSFIRSLAVRSYLLASNAEESKNILLRFLVGNKKMDDYARSSLYVYAKDEWDSASSDKKNAIVEVLYEAASSESPPWLFNVCDSQLLLMNPAWRDSSRRKSMLKRQLTLQFSKHYINLRTQMEQEVRRISLITQKNTVNKKAVVTLKHAESLPHLAPLTNGTATTVQERIGIKSAKEETSGRKLGRLVLFCLPGVLLLGFGTWWFIRK